MKTLVTLAAVSMALAGIQAAGQDKPRKRDLKDRIDIPGTLVCIGCTLEKEFGAESQCTLYSKHAQGLLMADGTLWTLVDNAKGHVVAANDKLRGREVKLFGWKYPKSQYIEVFKYQVKDGDKWIAWDYCKTCGFEKGDNQDADLCEDCKGK